MYPPLSLFHFFLFLLSPPNGRRFLSLASPLSVPRSRRDEQFLPPKLCCSKRWNLEVRVYFSLELAVLWNFTNWIAVSFFISSKKSPKFPEFSVLIFFLLSSENWLFFFFYVLYEFCKGFILDKTLLIWKVSVILRLLRWIIS